MGFQHPGRRRRADSARPGHKRSKLASKAGVLDEAAVRHARALSQREAALASTLVIGSQSYPLFAQPLDVVDAWAAGFEKVWDALRS